KGSGKPQIKNPDGTVSTERTITIEANGRHFVLPTIRNGKQLTEDQAIAAWERGEHQAVGEFATAEEANRFARERTARLSEQLRPARALRPSGAPGDSALDRRHAPRPGLQRTRRAATLHHRKAGMSLDLYQQEAAERVAGLTPVQQPEVGAFDGFLRGAGMTT